MKRTIILWICLVLASATAHAAGTSMLEWGELPPLPSTTGVAGAFAGRSGDVLLVAGGTSFSQPVWEAQKVWHDEIYALTRETQGTGWVWTVAGRLPQPLAYGMSVSCDDAVCCLGGESAGRISDAVFVLRWDAAARMVRKEALPPLPQPCAYGQAALAGDTLYVAGGQSGAGLETAMRTFWRLDLSKRGTDACRWETLPPCPGGPRALAALAAQNNGKEICLYLFGGRGTDANGGTAFFRQAYEFSPRGYQDGRGVSAWRALPDMPVPLAASPCMAVGEAHIFLFGGDDGSLFSQAASLKDEHPGFPRRVWAYHTITETWTEAGASPLNQAVTPAVPWAGGIVIPSGEIRPRVRTPRISLVSLRSRPAHFGWANSLTVMVYLAAMVGMGLYFSRRNKSTDDFFRGGQRIPWWAAGCSIFATMLSSITFMALPAVAFKTDWTTWVMHWMIPVVAVLVVWKILPFFRRIDATSAYEYLEQRFNYSVRVLGSLLFILFQVGRMGVVMYLPALALQAVTGLSPVPCILLMGVISILYSAMGGVEAVIWTDTVQTFVLLGGALLSVVLIMLSVDGGLAAFFSTALAYHKFHLVDWDFGSSSYMAPTCWVIVLGAFFQHLSSYTADQAVVQRYMTTDTEKNAARAILGNSVISVLGGGLLFFMVGTALFVYYRSHPAELDPAFKTDAIFPLFIATRMPPVAAGLVVAGVFAAAQSTLATSMNSMASALVTDFARPMRLCRTDGGYLRLARGLTILLGMLGTLTAVMFVVTDVFDIYSTYITILGLFMGVLCGLFVLGMFTRRATSFGCLSGAALTAVATLWLAFRSGWGIHGYLYPAISVVGCLFLGYVLSFLPTGCWKPREGTKE